MHRELLRRNFIPSNQYIEDKDVRGLECQQRIKEWHRVICYGHDPEARELMLAIQDRGVRTIFLGEEGTNKAPLRYRIERTEAVGECLRAWKKAGVGAILATAKVAGCPILLNAPLEAMLREACVEERVFTQRTSVELTAWLEALAKQSVGGVVFGQAAFIQFICQRAPDALWELMRVRRVLLPYGQPLIDFTPMPEVPHDLVRVDWPAVAERIVEDIEDENEAGGGLRADYLPARLTPPVSARLRTANLLGGVQPS